jgi:hypothetical protein
MIRALLPLLALVAATPAFAQAVPPAPAGPGQPPATIVAEPAAMLIASCDANRDGATTRAELAACIAHTFADVDTGGTGAIGYIAFSDWALKWLGDRNALPSPFDVDADHDDRITLAEMQAQFDRLFDRFDADRNGAATRAELLTIRGSAVPQGPVGGKRGRR